MIFPHTTAASGLGVKYIRHTATPPRVPRKEVADRVIACEDAFFHQIIDGEVATHPRSYRHRSRNLNGAFRFRQVVPDVIARLSGSPCPLLLEDFDTDQNLISKRPYLHREVPLPIFIGNLHFQSGDAGFAAK